MHPFGRSSLALNPLEPRTLFAADLVAQIPAFDGEWLVPGEVLGNTNQTPGVVVRNQGDASPTGTMASDFYLSRDSIIGNSDDIFFGSFDSSIPATDQTPPFILADFPLPTDLALGDYYLDAKVDSHNTVPESGETNNTAISATAFIHVLAKRPTGRIFGTPGDDHIYIDHHIVTAFEDDDGRLIVFVNGSQTIMDPPSGPIEIDAGAGRDRIVISDTVTRQVVALGGKGNDRIYGGSLGSTLSGGDGNDMIFGSTSADLIVGGTGNDRLYGLSGFDTLLGYGGNDFLDGGEGQDSLAGMGGNDTLFAQDGFADTLTGGLFGADSAKYDKALDTVAGIEHVLS
jgi:Ca2+-binding RTX toxin-like protein